MTGKRLLAAFLGASLLLSGCGPAGGSQGAFDASSEENGKLKVAVTLFPYYDFVRQIAGDQVDLQMVIPAGMDSHSFEPTPADIRTIQHADVLISNGGTMEHWLEDTLGALDTSNMTIVIKESRRRTLTVCFVIVPSIHSGNPVVETVNI